MAKLQATVDCLMCPVCLAVSCLKIKKWPENLPMMHRKTETVFLLLYYYADYFVFSMNKYQTTKCFSTFLSGWVLHHSLLHLVLEHGNFLNTVISQGSVAMHLRCGGLFNYCKFSDESGSERILPITSPNANQFSKVWCPVFLTHSVDWVMGPRHYLWLSVVREFIWSPKISIGHSKK